MYSIKTKKKNVKKTSTKLKERVKEIFLYTHLALLKF